MSSSRQLSSRVLIGAVLVVIAILGLGAINFFLPFVWFAKAIAGEVIEKNSGKPIPGAVVIANWPLEGMEGSTIGQLTVHEAVTDASGRFHLPAWGPKFRFSSGGLSPFAPKIEIFRRGYLPFHTDNSAAMKFRTDVLVEIRPLRAELETPAGFTEEYASAIADLSLRLTFSYHKEPCWWKHVPKMHQEIRSAREELTKQGMTVSGDVESQASGC